MSVTKTQSWGPRVRGWVRAIAGTATVAMWLVAAVGADEVIDRVLAIVAGDAILLTDVMSARELGLVDPGTAPDPTRTVLSRLIDRALMLDEVDRYAPPEPAADAVDRGLDSVVRRFPSREAFDQVLARHGMDERQIRDTVRQDLRIRAYLEQRFTADTPERTQTAIEEWVAGLRRRADIVDLYRQSGEAQPGGSRIQIAQPLAGQRPIDRN